MKIARIAIAPALALTLVGGLAFDASANAKGDDAAAAECGVFITGGEVSNQTDIFISADAGTAISDASGGSNNVATGGGGDGGDDGSVDVASAGNGGGANASANGGAVSLGDINSGGNAGNAIVVGDSCGPVAAVEEKKPAKDDKYVAPVEDAKVYEAPAAEAEAEAEVVALPSTGVGGVDAGLLSAIAAAGAAGAAGLGLRRR